MTEKITHLKPAEVAERLRVSIGTLANLRYRGGGPKFIHFGRRVLYPLVELERFERENLKSATSVQA